MGKTVDLKLRYLRKIISTFFIAIIKHSGYSKFAGNKKSVSCL